MLVTNHQQLAELARSLASLGYGLDERHPRISKEAIKSPEAVRHYRVGWNYRMSDAQATLVLEQLEMADELLAQRRAAAELYRQAHTGCDWVQPQVGNEAYWCYAVALNGMDWRAVADAVVRHGGERPYGAWRLTYTEPAYRGLQPPYPLPVAEALQPRLMQFQTNNLVSARRNAEALAKALTELTG